MTRITTNLRTLFLVIPLSMTCAVSVAQVQRPFGPVTGKTVAMKHGGEDRAYRIHVPGSYTGKVTVPLVMMLHGGGGTSEQASRMGMTSVADAHGFITVYPNAINKHWNDGRDSKRYAEQDARIDDVAFLTAVVDKVRADYKIDDRRIFVTGLSNGGFMSQRLAVERSNIFAAAGIVIATMGEPLSKVFKPEHPVSMLFMNGTKDPLVPYDGGEVVVELFPKLARLRREPQPGRGTCISTDDAVTLWLNRNGLNSKEPAVRKLPDADPTDGSEIELKMWTGGEDGTAVALYRVNGGGHVIPGGTQYLPKVIVGEGNRDIDGLTAIWKFFDRHGRKSP